MIVRQDRSHPLRERQISRFEGRTGDESSWGSKSDVDGWSERIFREMGQLDSGEKPYLSNRRNVGNEGSEWTQGKFEVPSR